MENQQQNSNSFWNNIIEEYLNGESMNKLSIKYNINFGMEEYNKWQKQILKIIWRI